MNANEPLRLTKLAKRAGCAAKHPPGFLLPLLGMLPAVTDERVIVGSSTADDAAIYKLNDEMRRLVFTTDFFTPIVDSPRRLRACRGRECDFRCVRDGWQANHRAEHRWFSGFAAGHGSGAKFSPVRVRSRTKPALRLSAGTRSRARSRSSGLRWSARFTRIAWLSNAGAKPGDLLILTKPLGLGIITTAAKNDQDSQAAITEAIRVMIDAERQAAANVLQRFEDVHALTDVTGFGLLGHLRNVTSAEPRDGGSMGRSRPECCLPRETT